MLLVMRDPNEPPRSEFITVMPTKSGLEGLIVGTPRKIVDWTAPGRSIISTRRSLFGLGTFTVGGGPFFQSENAARTAFSTAASSKRPATYNRARAAPKFAS